MKFNPLILLLVLISSTTLVAQKLYLQKEFSIQADFFTVDNFENIYTVKGDELFKFNKHGDLLNQYSSKLLGNITSIDVSNPLKILVYYQDLAQIVFLDNTLSSQNNTLALDEINLEQVNLVCSSVNSSIWAYDPQLIRLVRLDNNSAIIAESANIYTQIRGELNPNFMVERNNWLYLNNPEKGILVFDIFGAYAKTIPLKNLSYFQIAEGKIYYATGQKLNCFDQKTLSETSLEIPHTAINNIRMGKNKLFVLDSHSIKVYEIRS